ncbi:MAG: DUF7305 domain-containing protein [Planctomycetota bacterium]|jgi:hypothetical protein
MKRKTDNIMTGAQGKRRGMIMPLVATIMIFIFLLGLGMLKVGFGSRFTAARTSSEIMARSAADAGLGVAMYEIKKRNAMGTPPPWIIDSPSVLLPNSRASYKYTVAPTTDFPHANAYRIHSVGTADGQARTVYAATWATSFWSFAIMVYDDLWLRTKMTLGVWDPEGTHPDFAPTIGTTSTDPGAVTLAPKTEIPGDIVVGAGADPEEVIDSKANSIVYGDTYPADTDIDFPPVFPPAGGLPELAWPTEPNGMTINTSRTYLTPVILDQGDRVTIVGDVTIYAPFDMQVKNDAEIYIAPNSSLKLYLGSSLIAFNGSRIINAEQDARNLKIYGTPTCTYINIMNSGEFWGAVYAPSAFINISNSGSMYGSFIGMDFEMDNSGSFYYDVRLLEMDPTNEPKFFMIQRWWERGDDVF